MQIIEKDKLIIDLKQKAKDLNKQIAKLNLLLNKKDEKIFLLEDKIQELLQNLKNFNSKINDAILENENLKKKVENFNHCYRSK